MAEGVYKGVGTETSKQSAAPLAGATSFSESPKLDPILRLTKASSSFLESHPIIFLKGPGLDHRKL